MSPNLPVPPELPDIRQLSPEPDVARYLERSFDVDDEDSGLNLRRAKSALLRYKWLVIGVTVLGTGIGVLLSRQMKPLYSANATVWIDQSTRGGGVAGPILAQQMLDPAAWVELVKSFVVMDSVVRDLHMNINFDVPVRPRVRAQFGLAEVFSPGSYRIRIDSASRKFTLSSREGVPIEIGMVGDSVGRRQGFRWTPQIGDLPLNKDVTFFVSGIRGAAVSLRERLRVSIDEKGAILSLAFDGTDPEQLATILNDVTKRFTAVAGNLKRQGQTAMARILAGQVAFAKRSLDSAEQALKAYEVRTITLPDRAMASKAGTRGGVGDNGSADPLFSNYFDMQVELSEVQHEREQIQKLLAAAPDSEVSVSGFERIKAVQQSSNLNQALQELTKKRADLRGLLYTYSERHPEVQKVQGQISTLEHTTIPALAKDVDGLLGARATYLVRQVASKGTNLREIPQRAIEGARLQRSAAMAEDLYTKLQQRLQEAQVAEASNGVSDVNALDMAVAPQFPVKDTASRILLMAFFGSVGLGGAGALLLDKVDSRFRYPDQVSRELGVTILGAIPHTRGVSDDMAKARDNAPLLEALRAIRLNLVYAYGTAGPMVITVTSPGRSEGKTFLTAHLARVFAENGQRTLVVEGDMRKGVLHRRLNLVRRPGLSDYLRGDAPIDQIVQKTKFPLLNVITAGTHFHHAPELLGTAAMVQLLAALRSRYDVILCDSPPLGAGIDPLLLAAATGNLLLVLRTGVSHRELTEAKLEVISKMPIRLLGAVLNDVPKDVVFSYYSYYLPGYETSEEPRPALASSKQTV